MGNEWDLDLSQIELACSQFAYCSAEEDLFHLPKSNQPRNLHNRPGALGFAVKDIFQGILRNHKLYQGLCSICILYHFC